MRGTAHSAWCGSCASFSSSDCSARSNDSFASLELLVMAYLRRLSTTSRRAFSGRPLHSACTISGRTFTARRQRDNTGCRRKTRLSPFTPYFYLPPLPGHIHMLHRKRYMYKRFIYKVCIRNNKVHKRKVHKTQGTKIRQGTHVAR